MKINLVVFDLDGTLISSHKTIYKSTLHALKELNIQHNIPEKEFYQKIGIHFEEIFDQFGFKVNDFESFVQKYKSAYFNYIGSSFLFDNVIETIKILKQYNFKIALLTTKAQDQAEMNIEYFNLTEFFDYIMGRRPGIAYKPSAEPLRIICNDLNIHIQETILIGDTEMDILCGKSAGAYTCAVTYGYRKKEELEKFYPDFIIDNISELQYILDLKK